MDKERYEKILKSAEEAHLALCPAIRERHFAGAELYDRILEAESALADLRAACTYLLKEEEKKGK